MDTFLRLCVVVLVISLGACAFHPTLKDDSKLAPSSTDVAYPCITTDYGTAKNCTLLTMQELGTLSGDAADFKLGTAYAALGIAIATAVNIAFDGTANELRMLATAAGSLVGLNTIVEPDRQRTIAKNALTELMCVYAAAESLQSTTESLGLRNQGDDYTIKSFVPSQLYDAIAAEAALDKPDIQGFLPAGRGSVSAAKVEQLSEQLAEKKVSYKSRLAKVAHFEALDNQRVTLMTTLQNAQQGAGAKLSSAVVDIRQRVRYELGERTVDVQAIITGLSDRVLGVLGAVLAEREKAKVMVDKEAPGDNQKDAFTEAQNLLANTSPAAAVAEKCISPEARDALKN